MSHSNYKVFFINIIKNYQLSVLINYKKNKKNIETKITFINVFDCNNLAYHSSIFSIILKFQN